MSSENRPSRLLRIPTRRGLQREIDDEMRFHLESRIDALMRSGLSRAAAASAAHREFGDVNEARRQLSTIDRRSARRHRWREWVASLAQDVRIAVRGLRSRPGFALTTLATLTLGIGANAAIFSVVYAVLIHPLPFRQPDRLVHLWEVFESKVDSRSEASYPDYLDWRARNRAFSDIAGYHGSGFVLGTDQATVVAAAKCTWNFFDVLGVRPVLGRTFARGEDEPGASRVVVLAYDVWQRQFAGDSGIVGRTVMLDGSPATVIGVLPESFQFAREGGAQLWAPIDRTARMRLQRGNHWLKVVARLRDGVTIGAAARDMSAIMRDLAREYPPSNAGRDAQVVSLRDELVGQVRPTLLALYGAVGLVLLIACANVANLLLMRGADRQREVAVRVALGAGRAGLVRQVLTESALLSIAGAACGLALAQFGVRSLIAAIPTAARARIPALASAGVGAHVLAYSAALALAAALAFGLAPALRAARTSVQDVLRNGARGSASGAKLRHTLVVGEIALTLMLLCGAMLFGRSLEKLSAVELGFRPDHVTTAGILLPPATYRDDDQRIAAFARIEAAVRGLPGVSTVGLTTKLPLDFGNSLGFELVGRAPSAPGQEPTASYRDVNPGYFDALGIALTSGRMFDGRDVAGAPTAGIVNRAFAKAYFDQTPPVGASLAIGTHDTVHVVGVVADVPIGNIGDRIPPTLYLPFAQDPGNYLAIAVRGDAETAQLARELARVVSEQARGAALVNPVPMDRLITNSPSVFMRRFPLLLIGVFAATALVLSIVGIYGVVSYSVSQRSREMGIRMALGAQSRSLVAMVVRQGGWLALQGVVLGVAATLLLSRFIASLLYGVTPSDPMSYVVVSCILALVAVSALAFPARRASRVDPAVTLRGE